MKILIRIIVFVALIMGVVYFHHWNEHKVDADLRRGTLIDAGDNEPYAKKVARYRAVADQTVLIACTNQITGIRAIISQNSDTSSDNFMQWSADATVEYVNQVGGVERTNLYFRFEPWSGKLKAFQKPI